jgi:hypothetical protein
MPTHIANRVLSDLISELSPSHESWRHNHLSEETIMKKNDSVTGKSDTDHGEPPARIKTDAVPESLRPALQSDVVRQVSDDLTETLANDPRQLPKKTPVASPGAPYRRQKSGD